MRLNRAPVSSGQMVGVRWCARIPTDMRSLYVGLVQNATSVVLAPKESSMLAARFVFDAGDCVAASPRVDRDKKQRSSEDTGSCVGASSFVGCDSKPCVIELLWST